MTEAMARSSNVAAIGLAQQMGSEVYHDYATRFGFGHMTGLDLKGESSGVLRDPSDWLGSDAGSIVIGQGMIGESDAAVGSVQHGRQRRSVRAADDGRRSGRR